MTPEQYARLRDFGWEYDPTKFENGFNDASKHEFTYRFGTSSVTIPDRYYTRASMEDAIARAGFTNFEVFRLKMKPDADDDFKAKWADYE